MIGKMAIVIALLEFNDLAAARCRKLWSLNVNLFFKGTSTVNLIHLMGPLKQSLVENISLQRCNCNIFGLTDTMALFAKEAGFYRF